MGNTNTGIIRPWQKCPHAFNSVTETFQEFLFRIEKIIYVFCDSYEILFILLN